MECCEPIHKCHAKAATPESLMRARFSAFAKKDVEFLIQTRHPLHRNENARAKFAMSIRQTDWLSLSVIEVGPNLVEFVAFYKARPFGQLHERSKFKQEGDIWFYTEGTELPPVKISRNQSCPCGSGKKYKVCCS